MATPEALQAVIATLLGTDSVDVPPPVASPTKHV